MSNTGTLQYNHRQGRMFWYVSLLAFAIVGLFVWSLVMSYQSSVIVYGINDTETTNALIAEQIAAYETDYHQITQDYVNSEGDAINRSVVAYSTRDENVRFAQVGGSVYSMLTTY